MSLISVESDENGKTTPAATMAPKRQFRLIFGKQYNRWIPASLGLAIIVGLKCVEARGLVADTSVSDQPYH